MSITETIQQRRATPPRFLSESELPKETIEQLLENANWAPSHKKTEPWRFKVYSGSSKAELSGKIYDLLTQKAKDGFPVAPDKIEKFKSNLDRVPVAIAIVLQRDAAERVPEWEEIAAVAMAVQNMWLTATEMELGAFWATPGFMHLFNELLGIEDGQKALGFFYVGKIALDYPSPGRGNVSAKTEWK